MSENPIIKKLSGNVENSYYQFYIPSDFIQFAGHFPELPLVPGVTQIYWVVDLIEAYKGPLRFKGMSKVKFMRPILPQETIFLTLKMIGSSSWSFTFKSKNHDYSSGHIEFYDE